MGESGRILRLIFERLTIRADLVITNVVSCRPIKPGKWGTIANRPPTPEEVTACNPKLVEVLHALPYVAVIYIGQVATKTPIRLPNYTMLHPASIARMEYKLHPIKEQALLLNRFLNAQYNNLQTRTHPSKR